MTGRRSSPYFKLLRPRVALLLVICAWALAVLPNLSLRAFIWEEGTNAELARGLLRSGQPFALSLHGEHWNLSPPLISWMIAGLASLTGTVNEWSARLPSMLSVLATALLVFSYTRRFASERAALFAAGSFLFCPLLLRKLTIAEPDTIVTAFLFAAFVVWQGGDGRQPRWSRLLACGLLLATAALAKGPQPIAYFALGLGGFLVAHKRWRKVFALLAVLAFPGIALISLALILHQPGDGEAWLGYMRLTPRLTTAAYLAERVRFTSVLLLDLLPMTLLAPFVWREFQGETNQDRRGGMEALLWYGSVATIALFLWPGANTRYAMPAAPAAAALAGCAFDRLWLRKKWIAQFASAVLLVFFAYQLALVWVTLPLFAERFAANRIWGRAFAEVVDRNPAPIINVAGRDANQLFYVARSVQRAPLQDALTLRPPAWLVLGKNELEWLKLHQPPYRLGPTFAHPTRVTPVAVRIEPAP